MDRTRKGYKTPLLTVYGTIREITHAAGNKTNADGATMGQDKTA